jgi:PAS domain S-box-containing protein
MPEDSTDKLRARVRAVFQSVPVGLVITDSAGKIQSVNAAFEKIFQTTGGSVTNVALGSILPMSDEQTQYLLDGEPGQKRIELESVKATGEPLNVEVALCKINMANSDETNWLATIEDVTQRHEIERLKQEFVALVIHDLRNPLAALFAMHEMLQLEYCGPIPKAVHDSLSIAQRSTKRLINLVNNLLDVEKLEAGKTELCIENFIVAQLVQDSVEAVQEFARQFDISLDADQVDFHLECDGESIVRVLVNLISNAIKFSPRGSRVRIEVERSPDFMEFRVCDNGRGIAKENLERVFHPFVQIKETDARKIKGTGLGLQICKKIIEQHGGSIGVASELGSGSTFWFRLPLSPAVL